MSGEGRGLLPRYLAFSFSIIIKFLHFLGLAIQDIFALDVQVRQQQALEEDVIEELAINLAAFRLKARCLQGASIYTISAASW